MERNNRIDKIEQLQKEHDAVLNKALHELSETSMEIIKAQLQTASRIEFKMCDDNVQIQAQGIAQDQQLIESLQKKVEWQKNYIKELIDSLNKESSETNRTIASLRELLEDERKAGTNLRNSNRDLQEKVDTLIQKIREKREETDLVIKELNFRLEIESQALRDSKFEISRLLKNTGVAIPIQSLELQKELDRERQISSNLRQDILALRQENRMIRGNGPSREWQKSREPTL